MHQIFVLTEEDKLREAVKYAVLALKLKRVSGSIDDIMKMKNEFPPDKVDYYMKMYKELLDIRNNLAGQLARPIIK